MNRKRKSYGFTLLELVLSMGLWIILLSTFTASLFFGMRQMMANYDEISEYTRVSLFFDTMQSFIQDKAAVFEPYKKIENAFLLKTNDGKSFVLYFFHEKDKDLDAEYSEKDYYLVLSPLDKNEGISYGIGRRIMEKLQPPPASRIELEGNLLTLRVMSSTPGFGPYQTSILLK